MLELEKQKKDKENNSLAWWVELIIGIAIIIWGVSYLFRGFEIDPTTRVGYKNKLGAMILYLVNENLGIGALSGLIVGVGVYMLFKAKTSYEEKKLK